MSNAQPSSKNQPRLRGLVGTDPAAFAERNGGECVAFGAVRGAEVAPRAWLAAAAAMAGAPKRQAGARVEATLARVGLALGGRPLPSRIDLLDPVGMQALALAELAIVLPDAPRLVVVPQPPSAWPTRHEIRRLAIDLFGAHDLVLHATEGTELLPLMPRESLIDDAERPIAAPPSRRAMLLRTWSADEAWDRLRDKLEVLGLDVQGGPHAHRLEGPLDVGPREVLAAAYDAEVDVIEVRDLP